MTSSYRHRNGWGSTLSLNAMPTDSYGIVPEQTYGVPFRRSKSVRNLSVCDDDTLDMFAGRRHVRRIVLRRSSDLGVGLGFSIRGGRELGIGIFVSKVMERSVADRAGLMPGDEILSVNNSSFENISHEEAIKILKAAPRLDLIVCSPARIPGACIVHQTYTWLDSEGRSVSPPPEYDHSFYSSPAHRKAVSRLHHSPRIRKVTLRIDKGQSLGLMIRGGIEYGLGVYITGVDKHSVADMAALKVGDQILEVNNQSFLDITHDEAVRVLKYSPEMVMTIREVGKVPYSCTTYDENSWLYERQSGMPSQSSRPQRKPTFNSGLHPYDNLVHTIDIQALRILNEKAKLVLTKAELATLNYYRIEYERNQMTIDSFVAVLLELFETEDKYALLQDVREVIHPVDLHRFDEVIYKKDLEMARTRQRLGADDRSSRNRFSSISMDHLTSHVASSTSSPRNARRDVSRYAHLQDQGTSGLHAYDIPRSSTHSNRHHGFSPAYSSLPGGYASDEDLRTPSEDSGVDSTNGSYYVTNRSSTKLLKHGVQMPLTSSLTRNGVSGRTTSDNWQHPINHGGYERRRRSIEDVQGLSRYVGENDYQEEMMAHQRSSNDRRWSLGSEQSELGIAGHYSDDEEHRKRRVKVHFSNKEKSSSWERFGKKSKYWFDKRGNMIVIIEKSKPTLGVVIEGGADTNHCLPRIVNIQPDGAAFEAGGLRVGHIVLSVGKFCLRGLDHKSAASLIATAYHDPRYKCLKLVVTEAKRTAKEVRQKSMSFLYGE